jgi:hypothetical protein
MKRTLITLYFIILIQLSFGQTTISISGKVIDESFLEMPGVLIFADGKELATTELNGKFQTEIEKTISEIEFRYVGMETLKVKLKDGCNNLELILLNEAVCYLGASLKKVNRIRKRKFDSRIELHKIAYQNGIFLSEYFCGEPQFKPYE